MVEASIVRKRLNAIRAVLETERLDALLVTAVSNVTYLSGFTGDDSLLLVTGQESFLVTDSRYTEQADRECSEARVVEHRKGLVKRMIGLIRRGKPGRVGFEDSTPFGWYRELRAALGARRLMAQTAVVERQRQVKDTGEVALIRRALGAAEWWWPARRRVLRPGRTEREVAADLAHAMGRRGADGPAFETLVAVGPRASLPHAKPTARTLTVAEAVLIDWGAQVAGYKCDLTRVVPGRRMTAQFRQVYGIVLEAQEAAIAAVRPGVTAGSVDAAARSVIARAGYGKEFGHGLGHGVGLAVHELPRIRKRDRTTLEPGMVFTIEPGIYLPGRLGVRMEDMVVVTERGVEVLSSLPKRLDEVTPARD